MTTTSQGIDGKQYLIGWINGLVGMTSADINAIPADKWTASFGGCARPANALAADAISLLYWTAEAIRGNVISGNEQEFMEKLTSDVATQNVAVAKLKDSADQLCAALAEATDERLNEVVTPPWQMPAPLFMIAQIAASHIWYHDGQFCYIQCLLGDDKIHWMDGQ